MNWFAILCVASTPLCFWLSHSCFGVRDDRVFRRSHGGWPKQQWETFSTTDRGQRCDGTNCTYCRMKREAVERPARVGDYLFLGMNDAVAAAACAVDIDFTPLVGQGGGVRSYRELQ